jgi:hypothetical protein
MRRLRPAVERIADALGDGGRGCVVWRQDSGGADVFTSARHPGVTLARAELRERAEAPGVTRIVVRRASP